MSNGANVIVGDMNYGCIHWVNLRALKDDVQDVFLDFCVKH